MIRVLHVVGIMNHGGIENFLMNVYRKLDRSQIQFDFLVTREEEGLFDNEIRALGGQIYNIPHIKKVGKKKHVEAFVRILKQSNYKIVHCHMSTWCWLYLPVAKREDVPIRIAHSHVAHIKLGNPQKVFEYLCKLYTNLFIDKYATHNFACSFDAGVWLFGHRRTGKVKTIRNAIDVDKFSYDEEIRRIKRRELGIEENDFIIGHIGRMDYPKNHSFLIDIFNNVVSRNKHAKLILVGNGKLCSELQSKVKRLNLIDRVVFLGIRSDVNELLSVFDVFLFPSRYEGFGIVLLEAQAAGLKCISSDSVPKNTDMGIGNIEYISLKQTTDYWAERVLLKCNSKRTSDVNKIKALGFDIQDVTEDLSNLYSNGML